MNDSIRATALQDREVEALKVYYCISILRTIKRGVGVGSASITGFLTILISNGIKAVA